MKALRNITDHKTYLAAFLLISVVLGPGVSYGNVYLFHLVLIPLVFFVFLNSEFRTQGLVILKKPSNLTLIFALIWLVISISWAENRMMAISYVLQFAMGLLVLILCQIFISKKEDFVFILNKVLLPLFLIILAIGLLESFTHFRWPISSISYHNNWFGRVNTVDLSLKTERIPGYLLSSPTVFFFNPNHLAVFLCFFIPFLMKSKWTNYILFVASVVIMVQTGSRLTLIALLLILLLFSLINRQKFRFLVLYLATLFLPMVFLSHTLFAFKANEPLEKITGVSVLSKVCLDCSDVLMVPKEEDHSQNVRWKLYTQGIDYIKQTKLLGVGAGNAEWFNYKQRDKTNNVTSVHFYWLELFVNGGIVLILLLLFYFGKMFLNLWRLRRNPISQTIIMALFLFSLAVISLSSAHYFLSYYASLGLIAVWFNLNIENNDKNTVAG